jgi:hypothetical protein
MGIFFGAAKLLNLSTFASFQVNFGFAGIAVWFGDFGLLNLMIIYKAQTNSERYKICWSLKNVGFLVITILSCFLLSVDHLQNFSAPLYLTSALDIYTDSFVALRQTSRSTKQSFWIQFLKKLFQISILILIKIGADTVSLFEFVFALTFPSIAVLSFEIWSNGKWKFADVNEIYSQSGKLWAQSGGTTLAGLDLWIVSQFGGIAIVPIIAVARRFGSIFGTLGSVLAIDSMHNSARDKLVVAEDLKKLCKIGFLFYIPAFILAIFSEEILQVFLNSQPSQLDDLLFTAVILASPLAIITASLNGMLLGLKRFRAAASATYLSTIAYILIFCVHWIGIDILFVFIAGWYVNVIIELLFELYFLSKVWSEPTR